MYSVFLSSYRNIRESLGELKKLWKHSPAARVPTAFLVLPNVHCFYLRIRLWARDFYRMIADEGTVRVNYRAMEERE